VSSERIGFYEHLFTQKWYPKGTLVFEQGDPARMVFFVKEGEVRISRLTRDGKEVLIALLHPGDIFGEEVMFSDAVRTTIATCKERSMLCMAKGEDLYGLMTREPVLAFNIAKYVAEQRDDAVSVVEDLSSLNVPDRLLSLFARLAADYGIESPSETLLNIRLTQADIAALIGSTRETVSLEMSRLVKSGAIRMQSHSIVLLHTSRSART
jgi:CRP/FNR family cyclic AMP-dependent transcriptional regulator